MKHNYIMISRDSLTCSDPLPLSAALTLEEECCSYCDRILAGARASSSCPGCGAPRVRQHTAPTMHWYSPGWEFVTTAPAPIRAR